MYGLTRRLNCYKNLFLCSVKSWFCILMKIEHNLKQGLYLIGVTFQVNRMVADLEEREFGPPIGIREYSFLDNPLLDNKVNSGP